MNEIENDYFEWMYRLCIRKNRKSYRKLLMRLHNETFRPALFMDENRAKDGESLRWIFANRMNLDMEYVKQQLDNRPCSCLEMMVALARRAGEEILLSPNDECDAVPVIFMDMLVSMGADELDDRNFNIIFAKEIIDCCFGRRFDYTGKGGLFEIPDTQRDMKKVEFWYQAMWYIDKNYI